MFTLDFPFIEIKRVSYVLPSFCLRNMEHLTFQLQKGNTAFGDVCQF